MDHDREGRSFQELSPAQVAKFDVNGDGEIDKQEFTEIVRKTGCVEVLTQDELGRQLRSAGGMQCVKLPTKKSFTFSTVRTHPTAVTLVPSSDKPDPTPEGYYVHDLYYTKRKGEKARVPDISRVAPDDHKLNVVVVHSPKLSAPLLFEVSPLFRDPLVDLLTLACTGVPLPIPTNVTALRRGTDLSLDKKDLDKIIDQEPVAEIEDPTTPLSRADSDGYGEDE